MNICGQFLHRIHPNGTKSRKYFKMSFSSKLTNQMQQQETVASGWLIYLKYMMMHGLANFTFISKCNLRPSGNYGFYCVDFPWNLNYSTKLCAKRLYRIYPNQSLNVATTGRNSFIPRRKVCLSLGRFLWNACLVDNFYNEFLTQFHENPTNSLFADVRWKTDGWKDVVFATHNTNWFL